jgi:hypothetical protein
MAVRLSAPLTSHSEAVPDEIQEPGPQHLWNGHAHEDIQLYIHAVSHNPEILRFRYSRLCPLLLVQLCGVFCLSVVCYCVIVVFFVCCVLL